MENINTTAENQQTNTQPEESGAQRTFTQEEVNKIVSERLERERNKKVDNSEYETRLKELTERENKFACKEFLKEHQLPDELLEVINTSDVEKFKATAESIGNIYRKRAPVTTGLRTSNNGNGKSEDVISKAFQRK